MFGSGWFRKLTRSTCGTCFIHYFIWREHFIVTIYLGWCNFTCVTEMKAIIQIYAWLFVSLEWGVKLALIKYVDDREQTSIVHFTINIESSGRHRSAKGVFSRGLLSTSVSQ